MKKRLTVAVLAVVLLSPLTSTEVESGPPTQPTIEAPYAFRFNVQPGADRRECVGDLEIRDVRTGKVERSKLRCRWGSECQFSWCSADKMMCYVMTLKVDVAGDTASWKALVYQDDKPVVSQEVSVRLRA